MTFLALGLLHNKSKMAGVYMSAQICMDGGIHSEHIYLEVLEKPLCSALKGSPFYSRLPSL